MSDKPSALVRIDDLAANVRSTMARVSDVFSPSMRKQLGQIIAEFLRQRLAGNPFIHPGMAKMARWGQCKERQARKNFTRLKHWGVVAVVAYPKGGRRACRFVVNFQSIKALLVEMGANPSQALCDKLMEAENPALNPALKLDKNPALRPVPSAAGIHTKGKPPFQGLVTHPQFSIRGPRDV